MTRTASVGRLSALGFKTYRDYLRSRHWADVKARYRASDLPQSCFCCAEEEVALHHTTYERLGAECLTDLVPLCRRCHTLVHVLERRGDLGLDLEGLLSPGRALKYEAAQQVVLERRRGNQAPTWGERLDRERVRFLSSLASKRVEAKRRGISIDSDIKVILRRLIAIDQKLGVTPIRIWLT